ncbi:putative nucleotide-diphospho-sugar transferase [Qingshengfaniella alkalisoli]|uniref:Nucleotide-diphospho-sugar transferase domain-containing protein n=1 Tax=Qingshengfaniella alkalisoli TaxID=2599296 RepID=A0A5B8IS31_9RHOB|nr:putative nucleotide-diphospho-sugar transferase [Qingshengfaniella alkalisoli]QDY68394.1 hypothetical protein FPZ52_01340 [Qingshengfaniella alkalisoli]
MADTPESRPEACGVVFAVSGKRYLTVAEQAARSVRKSNPELAIDIFTDSDVEPGLFDAVHMLEKSWFRPKFESMIRSRFDKTIYLDADLVVVADISDVFEVLDHFDIAAAHVQNRNQNFARQVWNVEIPNAFPQINGGVIGVRKTPETTAFLMHCRDVMTEEGLKRDQPVFREMLWKSDLRLAILPPEYNVRVPNPWWFQGSNAPAPRILHSSYFIKNMRRDDKAPAPWTIYSPIFLRHVDALIRADKQLSPGTREKAFAPFNFPAKLRRLIGKIFARTP